MLSSATTVPSSSLAIVRCAQEALWWHCVINMNRLLNFRSIQLTVCLFALTLNHFSSVCLCRIHQSMRSCVRWSMFYTCTVNIPFSFLFDLFVLAQRQTLAAFFPSTDFPSSSFTFPLPLSHQRRVHAHCTHTHLFLFKSPIYFYHNVCTFHFSASVVAIAIVPTRLLFLLPFYSWDSAYANPF